MGGKSTQRCLITSKRSSGIPLHQRSPSKKVKNDNWWTPWWLFRCLCLIYKFNPLLDVCADHKNTKAPLYIDKKINALKTDWLLKNAKFRNGIINDMPWKKNPKGDIWCNPPNSELGKFLLKAYEQHKNFGLRIMMVIPTNAMSSNAFWDAVELPKERGEKIFYKPIYKRIEFLDKGKKPDSSARNAYLVVIWG